VTADGNPKFFGGIQCKQDEIPAIHSAAPLLASGPPASPLLYTASRPP
jgi:hypothetical protein